MAFAGTFSDGTPYDPWDDKPIELVGSDGPTSEGLTAKSVRLTRSVFRDGWRNFIHREHRECDSSVYEKQLNHLSNKLDDNLALACHPSVTIERERADAMYRGAELDQQGRLQRHWDGPATGSVGHRGAVGPAGPALDKRKPDWFAHTSMEQFLEKEKKRKNRQRKARRPIRKDGCDGV